MSGDRDQHQPGHPLRVPLGVGGGQRAAPGRAEHQPALQPEVLAQQFDVGDQVVGGVVLQRGAVLGGVRGGAAAAALVEQDVAEDGRVGDPPAPTDQPPPGPPCTHSSGGPSGFPHCSQ